MTKTPTEAHRPHRQGNATGVGCAVCSIPWPCAVAVQAGTTDQPLPPGPTARAALSPEVIGNA